MEQENGGKNWVIWALVPVCVVLTIVVTKVLMTPGGAKKTASEVTEEYAGGAVEAAAVARQREEMRESADAAVEEEARARELARQGADEKREAYARQAAALARPSKEGPAPDPEADRKFFSMGSVKEALSRAAYKVINNPKAISLLVNNEYVVRGFMSRDTVKTATASKASLAAYLKDPKNLQAFLNKPVVKAGIENQEVFDTMAASKLVAAMLDTPGAQQLMNDENAIAAIIAANPYWVTVLSDQRLLNALMKNPKTSGAYSRNSGLVGQ